MYLSDGNWFDFKDGKSYANSDLNKAPTFFNANAAFSEHNDIAFAFFLSAIRIVGEGKQQAF